MSEPRKRSHPHSPGQAAVDCAHVARLFRDHHPALIAVARSLGENHADAEDIVSDVFCRILSMPPPELITPAYLRVAVANGVRNARRKRRSRWKVGAVLRESGPLPHGRIAGPEEIVVASELLTQVQTAAASLGARSRGVFELRCLQGLSVDETADIMGIAPGSVRQQLCRARARLRSTAPKLED